MSEKLKGKLSISRPRGGDYERILISLVDETSRSQCVEIEIAPAKFAEALVGAAEQACEFLWRPSVVGMQHEHKTEKVHFNPYGSRKNEKAIRDALIPFEVDGWRGQASDLTNGHCSREGGMQEVRFFRHVPVSETGKETGGVS